MQVHILVIHSN